MATPPAAHSVGAMNNRRLPSIALAALAAAGLACAVVDTDHDGLTDARAARAPGTIQLLDYTGTGVAIAALDESARAAGDRA
jgi:hypothetical protein